MQIKNTAHEYGALPKLLHWLIVALFTFQYVAAAIMTRLQPDDVVLGITQASTYNWHKSIGLVALAVAVVRLIVRSRGILPDWAPTLTAREQSLIHRYEQALYAAMLIMPLSGFVYVMAGGYGVHLFEVIHLPNPIGSSEPLAWAAKWTHIACGYVILIALAAHIGLVLRHQLLLKDGLLKRMLPGRN